MTRYVLIISFSCFFVCFFVFVLIQEERKVLGRSGDKNGYLTIAPPSPPKLMALAYSKIEVTNRAILKEF